MLRATRRYRGRPGEGACYAPLDATGVGPGRLAPKMLVSAVQVRFEPTTVAHPKLK
nr:hypothetical protein [Actinidia tombus-like virus]